MSRVYGAVEAGGTQFVCAIGDETGKVLIEERFATQGGLSRSTMRTAGGGSVAAANRDGR
jgi:predicted NBD/HSP70 family sugar kinase